MDERNISTSSKIRERVATLERASLAAGVFALIKDIKVIKVIAPDISPSILILILSPFPISLFQYGVDNQLDNIRSTSLIPTGKNNFTIQRSTDTA